MLTCVRACARARWNFLSPNFVKSKLKGRMSLCTLRPDLSLCNYCWFVGEPISLYSWFCRSVDLRRRFSALHTSVSAATTAGGLVVASSLWFPLRAPAAPKRRLHPPEPSPLLACSLRHVVASRSRRLYTAAAERSTFKQGAEYNGSALSEKRLCPPPDGLASVFSPSDI